MSIVANYNGRQPNNTSYIKNFVTGTVPAPWVVQSYNGAGALTPASALIGNVYIPGNLYVDGSIVSPSDIFLKEKIESTNDLSDGILNLETKKYIYKNDPEKKIHYGFIAQEFEHIFPELVTTKPHNNIKNLKSINYLEIIPLLVDKMKKMQTEIDELKLIRLQKD